MRADSHFFLTETQNKARLNLLADFPHKLYSVFP